MTTISSLPSQIPSLKDGSGQNSASSVSRETQTAILSKQDLDISITTVEGDRFTLSADFAIVAYSGTYSRLDVSDSSQTRREQTTQAVASSNQIAASMVGDFSSDEIRDIVKAIRQLLKGQSDVSHGHASKAHHRMEKLSKLDTLQSIEASFQATTQVVSQSQIAVASAAPDSTEADSDVSTVPGTVSIEA